jgi:hypothetical protein
LPLKAELIQVTAEVMAVVAAWVVAATQAAALVDILAQVAMGQFTS